MTLKRDTFCSTCGTAYVPGVGYPRTCPGCRTEIWANPIPVAVVLVPIVKDGETGLLVIRRGIEPGRGKLALAGGFVEEHERWQEGGAREVHEETGIVVSPGSLAPFWYASTEPRPNRVLLFSVALPLDAGSLAPYTPDHETLERGLVFGPGGLEAIFAFPLHAEAVQRFFAARGVTKDHAFTIV